MHKVSYTTTLTGAEAICIALQREDDVEINRLQDLHKELTA